MTTRFPWPRAFRGRSQFVRALSLSRDPRSSCERISVVEPRAARRRPLVLLRRGHGASESCVLGAMACRAFTRHDLAGRRRTPSAGRASAHERGSTRCVSLKFANAALTVKPSTLRAQRAYTDLCAPDMLAVALRWLLATTERLEQWDSDRSEKLASELGSDSANAGRQGPVGPAPSAVLSAFACARRRRYWSARFKDRLTVWALHEPPRAAV